MLTSLNVLEVLMHSYYSGAKHERHDAPAVVEARQHLRHHGMIDREDEFCRATAKGEFFLQYLLTIPYPVETFEIPAIGAPHDQP